jgi:hypothetical protein
MHARREAGLLLSGGKYELARVLYRSFRDDHDLAEQKPPLPYGYKAQPPQGVVWGKLDNALEAMTPPDKDGQPQLMSFGTFEDLYLQEGKTFGKIAEVFVTFHPTTHPVLWRMLLAQVQIYETLLAIHGSLGELPSAILGPQYTELVWKLGGKPDTAEVEAARAEVTAARMYVVDRLASRPGHHAQIEPFGTITDGANPQ